MGGWCMHPFLTSIFFSNGLVQPPTSWFFLGNIRKKAADSRFEWGGEPQISSQICFTLQWGFKGCQAKTSLQVANCRSSELQNPKIAVFFSQCSNDVQAILVWQGTAHVFLILFGWTFQVSQNSMHPCIPAAIWPRGSVIYMWLFSMMWLNHWPILQLLIFRQNVMLHHHDNHDNHD